MAFNGNQGPAVEHLRFLQETKRVVTNGGPIESRREDRSNVKKTINEAVTAATAQNNNYYLNARNLAMLDPSMLEGGDITGSVYQDSKVNTCQTSKALPNAPFVVVSS